MAKISIAIPTYNRKDFLAEALKSILAQTLQDFEIIIFDNYSDYDIRALVAEFKDDRIKLLINESNIGNIKNFQNVFWHKFDSEYLVVFHDDDTMHSQMLELECKILDGNDKVVWVGGKMVFIKDGRDMFNFSPIGGSFYTLDIYKFTRLLLHGFHVGFNSVMYRISALCDIDFEQLPLSYFKWWDRPLMMEIAKKGQVAVIKDAISNNRVHVNQDSRADDSDKSSYIFKLYQYTKSCLPQPLGAVDKVLFEKSATNGMILTGLSFSRNFSEYKRFIKTATDLGLFKWWRLDYRGVYYALLATRGLLRKKFNKKIF